MTSGLYTWAYGETYGSDATPADAVPASTVTAPGRALTAAAQPRTITIEVTQA